MTLARTQFTTALFSLAIAAPMTVQGVKAACLDEVAALRAEMESGEASTRDHDADNTEASAETLTTATITPLGTGASTETGMRTDTAVSAGAEAGVEADADTEAGTEEPKEGEVDVTTTTGEVTVPVGDGLPRENWFGRPPSDTTAAEDLDKAERAAREGDEEACRARLDDAKAALSAEAG